MARENLLNVKTSRWLLLEAERNPIGLRKVETFSSIISKTDFIVKKKVFFSVKRSLKTLRYEKIRKCKKFQQNSLRPSFGKIEQLNKPEKKTKTQQVLYFPLVILGA